jgi:hypothetical protein
MSFGTIALGALAAVIVVVDYRRMAACVARPRRHARKAAAPTAISGLMAAASGRIRPVADASSAAAGSSGLTYSHASMITIGRAAIRPAGTARTRR